MSLGTKLATIVDAIAPGDFSPATGRLPPQPANKTNGGEGISPGKEASLNLSLAGAVVLPVAVFAITFAAIQLSHRSSFVLTLWPTNAVVLAALLRYAPSLRNYGSIVVGGAGAMTLAGVASGNGVTAGALLTAINLGEVGLAWALLSVFQIGAANLMTFKNALKFIVLAGAIAPIGSATLTSMILGSVHGVPWRILWVHSYPAHALGMLVVAPFLISITSPDRNALRIERRAGEVTATFAFIIVVGLCAAYFRVFVFLIVPIILLSTLRFGVIGATTSNLLITIITSIFVVYGIGQPMLFHIDLSDRILALQVVLAFTSLWCLPIAVLLKERDQLLGELSRANSQLKQESETQSHLVIGLRRHLSIAEEKERLRLSYELHDEAGQGLIAAILELNEIDALITGPARERLHSVRKKMEELGKTLHRISWELRPPSIDELGLRKALASYIAEWGERCSTAVDFHCDEANLDGVPSEIGTAVYRIVQEGLTNIVKHAGHPSDVSVVIRRVGATLQVIIEDNGCGFDAGAMSAKSGAESGLGLAGMRERLMLIGGTLEIESAVGAGTTIFARIALDGQRSAA
jgi:signal transduction histidine kinase